MIKFNNVVIGHAQRLALNKALDGRVTPEFCTVTFEDGGVPIKNPPTTQYVPYGGTAVQPRTPDPVSGNKSFDEWINKETGKVYVFSTPVIKDLTIVATWL